tara:strand:- start:8808 stop:9344 length:537 start_codon:yes stop_codon:yes gene_type:complete
MTEQEKRKGGGGKMSRSETVTVRLDPRLRYLAELAALKHRRSLSSFIEWAIEDALGRIILGDGASSNADSAPSVLEESATLWDVDEPDRFAKLAFNYPELLTHEEQKRWKLIRENGGLWRGTFETQQPHSWIWQVSEQNLDVEKLRRYWPAFCAVAKGEEPASALPDWVKEDPNAIPF